MDQPDFLIVGGGVIGMMLARNLADAGAKITLLERGECGKEASWAGGGIVSPLYPWRYPEAVTRLSDWSQSHYQGLAQELYEQSGCDVEYAEAGLLILRVEDRAEALDWAVRHAQPLKTIDRNALHALQPGLSSEWESGLWMPGVASVRNPRLGRALRICMQRHRNIRLLEQTAVSRIKLQSGAAAGVVSSMGNIEAGQTVICGGAWSAGLLESAGYALPLVPVRGQMLIHQPAPGLLKRVTLADGRYLIPRRDGRILVGSTLEYAGFEKQVTEVAYQSLRRSAVSLLPELDQVPVEAHWSGLRPGSPHGVPWMGDVPGVARLSVCAGHFRNGLVLAPASARFMSDLLLGRPSRFPRSDYAPGDSGQSQTQTGLA